MTKKIVLKKHENEISKAVKILKNVRDELVIREKQAGLEAPFGVLIRKNIDSFLEDKEYYLEGGK